MANMISEAAREMRRILIDEGPQPRAQLVTRLVPMVPPGKAHRTYVKRNHGKVENRFNWTEDQRIASGARTILDGMLHSAEQRGHIIRSEVDGVLYSSISDYGRAVYEHFYRRAESANEEE